jgi:hypothetical protein
VSDSSSSMQSQYRCENDGYMRQVTTCTGVLLPLTPAAVMHHASYNLSSPEQSVTKKVLTMSFVDSRSAYIPVQHCCLMPGSDPSVCISDHNPAV